MRPALLAAALCALPFAAAAQHAAHAPPGGHRHDEPLLAFVHVERLEAGDDGSLAWDVAGWYGNDEHRLWLRSDGERRHGDSEGAGLELLYGRPVARWWDAVAGVRHDTGAGPARTFAAIGVAGQAPGKFEVEATLYVGTAGRTEARIELGYDLLLSSRWSLQPSLELHAAGRDDAARGIGAGLVDAEAGLRLKFAPTPRFAPYVGVVRERAFGRSADLRRDDGDDVDATRVVAGFSVWF